METKDKNIINDKVKPILTFKERLRYTSSSQYFVKGMDDYLQKYITEVKEMTDVREVKKAYQGQYEKAANDYVNRFEEAEERIEKQRRPVKLYLGMFIAGGFMFYHILKKQAPKFVENVEKFVKFCGQYSMLATQSSLKIFSNIASWTERTFGIKIDAMQQLTKLSNWMIDGFTNILGKTGSLVENLIQFFSHQMWGDIIMSTVATAVNVSRETSWGRIIGFFLGKAKIAKQRQNKAKDLYKISFDLGTRMSKGQEEMNKILGTFGIMYHYDKKNQPKLDATDQYYYRPLYNTQYQVREHKGRYGTTDEIFLKRDSNGNIIKVPHRKVKVTDENGNQMEVQQFNLYVEDGSTKKFFAERGIFLRADSSQEMMEELNGIQKKFMDSIKGVYDNFTNEYNGSLFSLTAGTATMYKDVSKILRTTYQFSDNQYQLKGSTGQYIVNEYNKQGMLLGSSGHVDQNGKYFGPQYVRLKSYVAYQKAKAAHIHTYKKYLTNQNKTGLLDLTTSFYQKYKNTKVSDIKQINDLYKKHIIPIITKEREQIYINQVQHLFAVYGAYVFVNFVEQEFALRAGGIAHHGRLKVSRLDMMIQQSVKEIQRQRKQQKGQVDNFYKMFGDFSIDYKTFMTQMVNLLDKWTNTRKIFKDKDILVQYKLAQEFEIYKVASYLRNIKNQLRTAYQMKKYNVGKGSIYTFSRDVSNAALKHDKNAQGEDIVEAVYKAYDAKKNPQGIDKGYTTHDNGVARDVSAPTIYKSTTEQALQIIIYMQIQKRIQKLQLRMRRAYLLTELCKKFTVIKGIYDMYQEGYGAGSAFVTDNPEQGKEMVDKMWDKLVEIVSGLYPTDSMTIS